MLLFSLHFWAPIAQPAEQIPLKDKVPGSIPGGGTKGRMAELGDAEILR